MVTQELGALETHVRDHPVAHHRFLNEFGSMSIDSFRRFVQEQYRLSTTFPQALAGMYACAEDLETKEGIVPAWKLAQPLMGMLAVEHWGSRAEGAHSGYFIELATSLGLSIDGLSKHEPYEETTALVSTRDKLCRNRPMLRALGAIALGNEFVNSFIFPRYLTGAEQIRAKSRVDFPLGYFQVHVKDEIGDYKNVCRMIEPFLKSPSTPDVRAVLMSGANELLGARQTWYDALEKRLL